MSHKLRLTDEAVRQIETIGDYIARGSPDSARRWHICIRQRIETLSDSPERHAVLYSREQAGREVRQTFYGVYRILYTMDADTVYVLTVRHGARRPIGPTEIEGVD